MTSITPATRFDSFNIHTTYYKKVGDDGIEVNVLIPKDIKPGKHPLLVKWHGGGLVLGTAMYPDWFAAYFVPFILRNSAIVVTANYRLLPEHTGADILEDLSDFWTWFRTSLASFVESRSSVPLTLDFDHVMVFGESAGGYMTFQSAITNPIGSFKALLAQYPMTSAEGTLIRDDIEDVRGTALPGPEIIDEHLAAVKPGSVMSSSSPNPPIRYPLQWAIRRYGRYREFLGYDKRFTPVEAIEDIKSLPPTWIIHGREDDVVALGDSEVFAEKAKKLFPETEIRLSVETGGHGFDAGYSGEEKWLKEGLQWIEKEWLG